MPHRESPAIASLLGLGLEEDEARVYLALLELGPQPASVVAKKAKLKRGHTYNVLTDLITKGIVQEFEKRGVKYFTCLPPSILVTIIEQRQQELDRRKKRFLEVLPELECIRNPAVVPPKVRFFTGVEGIKQIYEDTIRVPNQDLFAIGDFEHYFPREHSKDLNDWMWHYCARRAKRGVRYVGIVNKSPTSDLAYRKRIRERRVFKMLRGVDLPVEINIYGNNVAIISSSHDMVGLIIEDKPIADMLRNFHRAMWKRLPDYRG